MTAPTGIIRSRLERLAFSSQALSHQPSAISRLKADSFINRLPLRDAGMWHRCLAGVATAETAVPHWRHAKHLRRLIPTGYHNGAAAIVPQG
jgi:hypothetical protein